MKKDFDIIEESPNKKNNTLLPSSLQQKQNIILQTLSRIEDNLFLNIEEELSSYTEYLKPFLKFKRGSEEEINELKLLYRREFLKEESDIWFEKATKDPVYRRNFIQDPKKSPYESFRIFLEEKKLDQEVQELIQKTKSKFNSIIKNGKTLFEIIKELSKLNPIESESFEQKRKYLLRLLISYHSLKAVDTIEKDIETYFRLYAEWKCASSFAFVVSCIGFKKENNVFDSEKFNFLLIENEKKISVLVDNIEYLLE